MFILPGSAAAVHPLADFAPQSALRPWHTVSSPVTALLTAVIFIALVRAVFLFALVRLRPVGGKVQEQAQAQEKEAQAEAVPLSPARDTVQPEKARARARWYNGLFGFALKWETLPPISLADALPITLHPPPPPPIRGRYIYRGGRGVGFVRRPEPAPVSHKVEAPLPALYDTQPASMAKLIMARHTFRRPASPAAQTPAAPRRAPSIQSYRPPSPPERSPSPPERSPSPPLGRE
ncbi:hypothetical protein MKEN_00276500 [Mycena kentingensis (nom. inval.)]|nr:hypothetical protein MKEN_00276500 [Mycena kentingensis (nom. inval.)]